MAAVTIDLAAVQPSRDIGSTTRKYHPTYTGPSLYVAGGDTGLAAALGVKQIVIVLGTITNGTTVLIPCYIQSTSKVQWFIATTGLEASGDLSAYSGVLLVVAQ